MQRRSQKEADDGHFRPPPRFEGHNPNNQSYSKACVGGQGKKG